MDVACAEAISTTLLRNALRSIVCDCNGRTATLLFEIIKINFARKPKENFDSEHRKKHGDGWANAPVKIPL